MSEPTILLGVADALERVTRERDALRMALSAALDLAAEGWAYADDYYRAKWNFDGRVSKLRALVDGQPSDLVTLPRAALAVLIDGGEPRAYAVAEYNAALVVARGALGRPT